jgi:hypothetical protein
MTKIQIIGLIEVTSQCQSKNGTRCFHDPIAKCDYLSYRSGYVRRREITGSRYIRIYQLNKTTVARKESTWQKGYYVESVERIMEMNPESRLEIIVKRAISYRRYLNK